jgi:hypothetical protein
LERHIWCNDEVIALAEPHSHCLANHLPASVSRSHVASTTHESECDAIDIDF